MRKYGMVPYKSHTSQNTIFILEVKLASAANFPETSGNSMCLPATGAVSSMIRGHYCFVGQPAFYQFFHQQIATLRGADIYFTVNAGAMHT